MATPAGDNGQKDKAYETVKSALIGILFLIAGWSYNSQTKLEDRLYQMSASVQTEAKAQAMEDRISRSIETRFSDLSTRLDLLLKLVQKIRKGSDKTIIKSY